MPAVTRCSNCEKEAKWVVVFADGYALCLRCLDAQRKAYERAIGQKR